MRAFPPEAFDRITEWVQVPTDHESYVYDAVCAEALFRHRRSDFDRIVAPSLSATQGPFVPGVVQRLAERLRPEERGVLLPALEAATQARAGGRDDLFRVVCSAEAVRVAPPCRAPAHLKDEWVDADRVRQVAPAFAVHVGGALLYAAACFLLARRSPTSWPALGMGMVGAIGLAIALVWMILADPLDGPGETSGIGVLQAILATPVAAVVGAVSAWLVIARAKAPALPLCLGLAALYAFVAGTYACHSSGY